MTGMTQPHIDPPQISLIKENHDGKFDKYFVKLKLCRYPTSPMLDLYEFKISLFNNGKPEGFLLSVRNFNMTLAASGILDAGTKCQYHRTLDCGEVLRQFDSLYADPESTETLNVDYIIRGLAQYFFPVNLLSK